MNVKKQIKKVAAVGASLAIAATTMVSALAYDLSDYPAPFVEDGVFNGAIVVGATAATQDVLGAIDIAASLQAESKSGVSVSGGSSITVEGGEDIDEIFINETQAYGQYTDSDLEGFVDSDFDFNDEDIDYFDYINISNGAIDILGSLADNSGDEDYGMDLFADIANPGNPADGGDVIGYFVEIESDFDTTQLGNGTSNDDEIEFKFLGKTIKITDFDGVDQMTVESSNEYYLQEGDKVTVDGHEVELRRVGADAVLVSVDGQTLSVDKDDSNGEEFDQADDFEVVVESLFYIEDAADNSATLQLGEQVSDTVSDGDSAETFGEPSDENDADWLWFIDANNGASEDTTVGIYLNIDRTGIDADEDDERNALALGESIDFPNNYASIEFAELQETSFTEVTVTVDDDIDLSDGESGGQRETNAWGLHFQTDGGDDFRVDGQDTSEVWVVYTSDTTYDVWYEDNDDETNSTINEGETFTIDIDNDPITIAPGLLNQNISGVSPSGFLNITFDATNERLQLWLAGGQTTDYFGTDEEEESGDLLYAGQSIGAREKDGGYEMTVYGAFFEDGDTQFSSGSDFVFSIPDEQQEATIVVKSTGSVVSASSSSSSSAYSVNPIGLGLGILDTDAPALGSKPMIVVGGPYANTVAAELLGNPTPEQISETFTDGRAGIWWFEDQQAMLVAGWSAQDTLGAAYVVAKYDQYDFAGDEIEVVVTSLDNIRVNTVS